MNRCGGAHPDDLSCRTYQVAVSAQALVGILATGGNPITSASGAAGFRMNVLPGISAGMRWNVVSARLPDIHHTRPQVIHPSARGYLPALNGEVAVALTDGYVLRPGVGGIGAVSLIGSYSYLPLSLFGADGFEKSSHGYGLGARFQLLNESFSVPGISLSVSRSRIGEVQIGDICRNDPHPPLEGGTVRRCHPSELAGEGGEASFDVTNWSTRFVIGKHLSGTGVSAGIGHDWYRGKATHAGNLTALSIEPFSPLWYREYSPVDISSARWTAFGGISYPVLVGAVSLEAGWQQGEPAVDGFEMIESSYDPRKGTWYGSLSARIAL